MAREHLAVVAAAMVEIRAQHHDMAHCRPGRLSLLSAFDHPGFSMLSYVSQYSPHPHAGTAEQMVRRMVESYDMWVPGVSENWVHMASFLHNRGPVDRLFHAGSLYAVDWVINDRFGRDHLQALTPRQRRNAATLCRRMIDLSTSMSMAVQPAPVERACHAALDAIRQRSPQWWFDRFVDWWRQHLEAYYRDIVPPTDDIPTVAEYTTQRVGTSGVDYTIALAEYTIEQFLPATGDIDGRVAGSIGQLWRLCGLVIAVGNDLFSFEKEVIRGGSAENVVVAHYLNGAGSLEDALLRSFAQVRSYVAQFVTEARAASELETRIDDPATVAYLRELRISCSEMTRATWTWQNHTTRYRSEHSIFAETWTPIPASAAHGSAND